MDGHSLPQHPHTSDEETEFDSNACDAQMPPSSSSASAGGKAWYAASGLHSVSDRDYPRPFLDIGEVRGMLREVGDRFRKIQMWKLRETSWENKMPWHNPRATFLAKGLEWPPEKFDSDEDRRAFYRRARERKPFLIGVLPTWTSMIPNLVLLFVLIYNPRA
eukprot:c38854_g1_i1 orf=205-690(+)